MLYSRGGAWPGSSSQRLEQEARVVLNEMIGEPVLPGFDRHRGDKGGLAGDSRWCPHHEHLLPGQSRAFKVGVPVETRSFGDKVAALPQIVGLGDILDLGL